jgi:hypothetical protein
MDHSHAAVWVDHSEARVITFGTGATTSNLIQSTIHPDHVDHKVASFRAGYAHEDPTYLTAIAEALKSAREILILGPGGARKTLAHFIHDKVPTLAPRIMGVEPFDGRSEQEVVDFARNYFDRSALTAVAQ